MKILFYRYNSICEPDYILAFKKAGLEVAEITEEIYRKDIPGEERVRILLENISLHQPLFVFSIDYFPFISIVCERVGIPYAALSVDCPVAEIYSDTIRNSCNRIFLFDRVQYDSVKDENPAGIRYMPLGAEADRLSELPYPDAYEYPVSFIGSLYNEKDKYALLKENGKLSADACRHMDELVSKQLKVPGLDIVENGLTKEDIEALKTADPSFYSDSATVVDMDRYVAVNNYLGNHLTSLDRIAALNLLAQNLPEGYVHLFTRSDTSGLDGRVVVHGGVESLKEMPEVIRKSCINLNLTSRTIRNGIPQRVWDIAGCGAFCLTDDVPALGELLEPGKHLDTFPSYDELPSKCLYYLDNPDIREGIAICGYEEVSARHTVLLRALEIVKLIVSEKLS